MPWIEPKTDWKNSDGVTDADLAAMEGNVQQLMDVLNEGRDNNWYESPYDTGDGGGVVG